MVTPRRSSRGVTFIDGTVSLDAPASEVNAIDVSPAGLHLSCGLSAFTRAGRVEPPRLLPDSSGFLAAATEVGSVRDYHPSKGRGDTNGWLDCWVCGGAFSRAEGGGSFGLNGGRSLRGGHHTRYGRNFPFIVRTARSPFGSATRATSSSKSIALTMPSPNSSATSSRMVAPYTWTISVSR